MHCCEWITYYVWFSCIIKLLSIFSPAPGAWLVGAKRLTAWHFYQATVIICNAMWKGICICTIKKCRTIVVKGNLGFVPIGFRLQLDTKWIGNCGDDESRRHFSLAILNVMTLSFMCQGENRFFSTSLNWRFRILHGDFDGVSWWWKWRIAMWKLKSKMKSSRLVKFRGNYACIVLAPCTRYRLGASRLMDWE